MNPKLTVPYWDFTIETTAAAHVTYDPKFPFTRTELLSPSWFGTVDSKDNVVRRVLSVFLCGVLLLLVVVVSLLLLTLVEVTAAALVSTSVAVCPWIE